MALVICWRIYPFLPPNSAANLPIIAIQRRNKQILATKGAGPPWSLDT
jgi:hypothetical protein